MHTVQDQIDSSNIARIADAQETIAALAPGGGASWGAGVKSALAIGEKLRRRLKLPG